MKDVINHPSHYTEKPFECIHFTDEMNFRLGNAFKYVWRCELKGKKIEDLGKAMWYLRREWSRSKQQPMILNYQYNDFRTHLGLCLFEGLQKLILFKMLDYAHTGSLSDIADIHDLLEDFEIEATQKPSVNLVNMERITPQLAEAINENFKKESLPPIYR